MCLKNLFSYNRKKVINDENVNDLDFIELLLEHNISENNKKHDFNTHNEINYFHSVFNMYINDLFQEVDYITIKNKEEEEQVYKYETQKIVQYILEYKIIIRNKSFSDLMNSITIFNNYEKERNIFIEQIKKMDINKIYENIDKEYVIQYKFGRKKIFINLVSCGVPNFSLYNYLMTFERKKCSIKIESNNIFVCYKPNNKLTFKFELGYNYNVNSYYGIMMKQNDYYKYMYSENGYVRTNIDTYNVGIRIDGGFVVPMLGVEKLCLDHIFSYHHINIYNELQKKYKNYEFNTFMKNTAFGGTYYIVME